MHTDSQRVVEVRETIRTYFQDPQPSSFTLQTKSGRVYRMTLAGGQPIHTGGQGRRSITRTARAVTFDNTTLYHRTDPISVMFNLHPGNLVIFGPGLPIRTTPIVHLLDD